MSESHREVTQVGPAMGPKLEVSRGENAGETFKLKLDTQIGREQDNNVVLLDLKSSRYHANIALKEGKWLLTDLNSANGTFLNGTPVLAPMSLRDGDRITIGETDLMFRLPSETSAGAKATTAPGVPSPAEVPRRGEASQPVPVAGRSAGPAKTLPLVWIVGGAIMVLCAVAVLVVYLLTARVGDETEPVANITAPAPRPSVASVQGDGGAQTDGPSANVSGRPSELVLVYEEDFSDSFSGWDDAFDAYTRKVYGNNRYNIEVYASNLVAWGLANRVVSDFEIEVEAKLEDGDETDSYGLLFRFEDRNNFYRFDVSGDGYYLFSKFVDGEWVTLVDWTPSEYINTGNTPNILKVSAFGPNITLWANGQELVSLTDDSLTRGNFGFFTGTFSVPYSWVSFDNLRMWTAPDEELTLIPTPTPLGADVAAAEIAAAQGATAETPSTPQPTATATAVVAATTATTTTATITATAEATVTPENVLADGGRIVQTPEVTPTTSVTSTSAISQPIAATATPVPLPAYASRNQTLARGEEEAEGRIVLPIYDAERGVYDIYIADIADGDSMTLVQSQASQPALSPDGSEITYRSWRPDKRGLFARTISGDSENAWGFDLFFESARPHYSPVDGSLMYHSRTGGREPAIYRVIDGAGQVMRLDGAPVQGKAAKWSPSGEQFVYSSCLGSSCGIILGNISGAAPLQLTDHPSDTNPEFSPDGQSIVFMSERGGNWEIYKIDIDGENLEALTSDPASDGLPTWSPDGNKLAFVSNRDGKWAVWVMNADGSNKRRQFVVDGAIDGVVQHDPANSFGWVEENIDWIP